MERVPNIQEVVNREALDDKWFDRFKEIDYSEAYLYFDGDKAKREEQRNMFLDGEIDHPVLDYPKIDLEKLENAESEFLKLKEDVLKGELNKTVAQAYRWRINEKLADIRLVRAAASGDMRRFKKYSEFVYGQPSKEVFSYTIQFLQSKVNKYKNSDNPDVVRTAEELGQLLPVNLEGSGIGALPEKDLIDLAKDATMEDVGTLVEIDENRGEYSAEEVKALFEEALESLSAEGWIVKIDENASYAGVDQKTQTIKIPADRKILAKNLFGLIAHEIGTHVARRLNGERSKLKLLGLGLDRYDKGEEGVATMRGQAIAGKVDDFARLERHLAISLVYGLDGKKRSFKEVYEFLEKHFLLKELVNGKNIEEAQKNAQRKSWDNCVRIFRGTDCKTPGVAFTKDIVYREGNIGVWNVIGKDPKSALEFGIGKYDPNNLRHLWILDTLGITEEELED